MEKVVGQRRKKSNFTIVSNTLLTDERLTWKAKGLLCYMLSRPDGWEIKHADLVKRAKDGKDAVTSAIKELEYCGYLYKYQQRSIIGKFGSWVWFYDDEPNTEKPYAEKPNAEKPNTEKPNTEKPEAENTDYNNTDLNNTDLNNTDLNNTNEKIYTSDFEKFWSIYPKKLDKKKASKSFNTVIKKYDLETILKGTRQYAEFIKKNKTETQFIKHASTFLNNDSFLNDFEEGGVRNEVITRVDENGVKYDAFGCRIN